MSNLATQNGNHAITLEQVLVNGNLSSLTPDQRVSYYNQTCESLGLNPMTKPFEYITLNGKLTLYAKRTAPISFASCTMSVFRSRAVRMCLMCLPSRRRPRHPLAALMSPSGP